MVTSGNEGDGVVFDEVEVTAFERVRVSRGVRGGERGKDFTVNSWLFNCNLFSF